MEICLFRLPGYGLDQLPCTGNRDIPCRHPNSSVPTKQIIAMNFDQAKALLFIPDSTAEAEALARTTHMGSHLAFAIDLPPLLTDPTLDPVAFTLGHVDRFRSSVKEAFSPFF